MCGDTKSSVLRNTLDLRSSCLGSLLCSWALKSPPLRRYPHLAPPFSSACKSGSGQGVPGDAPGAGGGLSQRCGWRLSLAVSWTQEGELGQCRCLIPRCLRGEECRMLQPEAKGLGTSSFCSGSPGGHHRYFRLQENVLGKSS